MRTMFLLGIVFTVLFPGIVQRETSGRTVLKPRGIVLRVRFLPNPRASECILRKGVYLYLSGLEIPRVGHALHQMHNQNPVSSWGDVWGSVQFHYGKHLMRCMQMRYLFLLGDVKIS